MGRKKETAPKAYQVRISTNALHNIDEITGYMAFINQQPLNAIKVGDAIFATIAAFISLVLFAQEKKADVDISVNKDSGGGYNFACYCTRSKQK